MAKFRAIPGKRHLCIIALSWLAKTTVPSLLEAATCVFGKWARKARPDSSRYLNFQCPRPNHGTFGNRSAFGMTTANCRRRVYPSTECGPSTKFLLSEL